MKYLQITCDDLGMHPSINRAIVALLASTPITAVSIMPTGLHFAHAVDLLRRHAINRVGVHLALTAEFPALRTKPLLPATSVSSLVDHGGFLPSTVEALTQNALMAEVAAEMSAQIHAVQAAGLSITHLDGHMFFYEESGRAREFEEPVRYWATKLGVPYRHRSSRTTTFIWDGFEDYELRYAFYDKLSESLPRGVSELILHPADSINDILTFSRSGPRRFADWRFYSAAQAYATLSANGVLVIGADQ